MCVNMLYSHIINMHIYSYTCRIHIDAIIKTSEDFFLKFSLPHLVSNSSDLQTGLQTN